MQKQLKNALVWLRRDLRATDNAALHHALVAANKVWCVFVFDRHILDLLPRRDRRVEFLHGSLIDLDQQLRTLGTQHGIQGVRLLVRHGRAVDEIASLAQVLNVQAVYANHDDEPLALQRDSTVRTVLAASGVALKTYKDHVIFERAEVLTQSAAPYTVFTPYKNTWLKKLNASSIQEFSIHQHAQSLAATPENLMAEMPALEDLGFERSNLSELKIPLGSTGAQALLADFLPRMENYAETRNFPAIKGPSYLSVHLRFGTVSIRELVAAAWQRVQQTSTDAGSSTWLSELIWRDFYHQILHHHPHVTKGSFKPNYDKISWEQGEPAHALFNAWCDGKTGYPLVDAAMEQIKQTGYMHNRLRMVVASFLTKHLGIDWRWGEAYFATHLNDFDLAANNGGWQWAASSGCDAQPYFRIFNPVTQSEKFDGEGKFIRRYLPQLAQLPDKLIHAPWAARPIDLQTSGVTLGVNYPHPIVNHDEARNKTLTRFGVVKTQ
jgi:deoxyribodipyrimidine photo-lyase